MQRLVEEIDPTLTLYYHQHMRLVSLERAGSNAVVRAYGRRVGLPARLAALLPRHRVELAEPPRPRGDRVRRRAARGRAHAARRRGATRGRCSAWPPAASAPSAATVAAARPEIDVGPDPVRRGAPGADARLLESATTARRWRGCATRR